MSGDNSDTVTQVACTLLTADKIGNAVFEVEDVDGTVTLRGIVEYERDIPKVNNLVQEQEGVVEVINELEGTLQ